MTKPPRCKADDRAMKHPGGPPFGEYRQARGRSAGGHSFIARAWKDMRLPRNAPSIRFNRFFMCSASPHLTSPHENQQRHNCGESDARQKERPARPDFCAVTAVDRVQDFDIVIFIPIHDCPPPELFPCAHLSRRTSIKNSVSSLNEHIIQIGTLDR